MKLLHQNVNQLSNKVDLITKYLQATDSDIVIMTEYSLNLENATIKGFRIQNCLLPLENTIKKEELQYKYICNEQNR